MSEGQTVRQRRPLDDLPLFGSDYDEDRDRERLTGQRQRVARAMMDGRWHTADTVAQKIHRTTGRREKVASVDRQMRYVRTWAEAEDAWRWEERDVGGGAKEYRLVRVP